MLTRYPAACLLGVSSADCRPLRKGSSHVSNTPGPFPTSLLSEMGTLPPEGAEGSSSCTEMLEAHRVPRASPGGRNLWAAEDNWLLFCVGSSSGSAPGQAVGRAGAEASAGEALIR